MQFLRIGAFLFLACSAIFILAHYIAFRDEIYEEVSYDIPQQTYLRDEQLVIHFFNKSINTLGLDLLSKLASFEHEMKEIKQKMTEIHPARDDPETSSSNYPSNGKQDNQLQVQKTLQESNAVTGRAALDTLEKSDCFDYSNCVLIQHQAFGRSGNRKIQLQAVEKVLSRCSGAAISPVKITDDVVRFSPLQVFGAHSCSPEWDQLPDIEGILGRLRSRSQPLNFTWRQPNFGLNATCAPYGRELQPGVKPRAPEAFQKLSLSAKFPSWLEINLDAWALPLDNATAVLHFRGGDILRNKGLPTYTQPVCDHYLQSLRHSGATCAILLSEDDSNPCVDFVAARFNCTSRRQPPACGASCAFTLLARARVAIASKSSFLVSLDAFGGAERRVYYSYCTECPRRNDAGKTTYCTDVNRTELFPWTASQRQLELIRTRSARVVQC